MLAPMTAAGQVLQTLDADSLRLILHHFAGEQVRDVMRSWESMQIVIALIAIAGVFIASEKRIMPLLLTLLMLAIVLVQFFGLTPEIIFRGREMDFPKPRVNTVPAGDMDSMLLLYWGVECIKLVAGAAVATYLFSFKSRRRRTKTENDLELARTVALRNPSAFPPQ